MPDQDIPSRAKLTSSFIAKLPTGPTDYLVSDEEQRKLKLKVTPAGNKSFILRYRNQFGAERKLKLGDWPDLNATIARKMAADALLAIATGADPAEEHFAKRNGPTVQDLAERFLRDYGSLHLRPSTLAGYRSYLVAAALADVLSKPAAAVTRQDIVGIQHRSSETLYQSNRLIGFVRRIYNYAIDQGKLPRGSNPTDGVKLLKESPREKILTADELASISAKLDELRRQHPESASAFDAIIFIFLTGCRKREALDLRWEDLDFDRSTVFFRKTKTDPRKQPMSEHLRAFLQARPSRNYSPYVFPGRTPDKPLENIRKPWDKIRQPLGLDRLRIHDIRHTVLSDIAAESDLQTAAIVGGHKSIRSTIRYVHGRTQEATRALAATAARTSKLFNIDPTEQSDTK
jgi:integrase